jgi:hypothetical protein
MRRAWLLLLVAALIASPLSMMSATPWLANHSTILVRLRPVIAIRREAGADTGGFVWVAGVRFWF